MRRLSYPLLQGQRCFQGPIWPSKGEAVPADRKWEVTRLKVELMKEASSGRQMAASFHLINLMEKLFSSPPPPEGPMLLIDKRGGQKQQRDMMGRVVQTDVLAPHTHMAQQKLLRSL